MALSEARLAANRANARKSTGPKTARGKARSRANALTHGLSASVLGRCEDGLRPVIGALHRPDPRDVEALLWPGATEADLRDAVQLAACLAQSRALRKKRATCLDQLEQMAAAQQAMVRWEPEAVARLGRRIDNPLLLMRRHYFSFPFPRILGRPWRPRTARDEGVSGLLHVQRYERALRRTRRRLLHDLDGRRAQALASGRRGSGAGFATGGGGENAGEDTVGQDASIACRVQLVPWPEVPKPRPVYAPLEPAEIEAILGTWPQPQRRASGSPEALAIVNGLVAEIEAIVAAKRTQAPPVSGPAGTAEAGHADRSPDPRAAAGSSINARPRPPPAYDEGVICILPGQGRVAWRPGPAGYADIQAGTPATPAAAMTGPLAAGRLVHEPRPHGLGPHDPNWPLIPPQPILDDRMNEIIVTLDPTGTRWKQRHELPEPPIGRWYRGPDEKFDRFRPGRGTTFDPYIPFVWWAKDSR
jgi:hypothetical protein